LASKRPEQILDPCPGFCFVVPETQLAAGKEKMKVTKGNDENASFLSKTMDLLMIINFSQIFTGNPKIFTLRRSTGTHSDHHHRYFIMLSKSRQSLLGK